MGELDYNPLSPQLMMDWGLQKLGNQVHSIFFNQKNMYTTFSSLFAVFYYCLRLIVFSHFFTDNFTLYVSIVVVVGNLKCLLSILA